jgi:hypothetical protein
MKPDPVGTVYLVLCSGCSRNYVLPYPRPQRQTSSGGWIEPDPWFCQRKPCREAEARHEQRKADQARIGKPRQDS